MFNILEMRTQRQGLAEDPFEKNNLADKDSYTVNLFRNQLKQFMQIENKGQQLEDFSQEDINRLKGLGYLR